MAEQYFNDNRYYMDKDGFHLTKVYNATELQANSLSFPIVFSSAYYLDGVEINTINSIRMMNDGATSWLSFKNTNDDETALLSLRTDKSFWLLARNEADVDGPCLGCISNINDDKKIIRYVKYLSAGIFQDMAGVYGDGTSYDHAKHSLEVKADPTVDSSNQTDGDFDHWDYDELTGWTFISMGGVDSECQTVHDDGVHTPYSGTYSLQLGSERLGEENEIVSVAASSITTLAAEDNAVVSVYAKYEETQTEGNIGFIFATALGQGAQYWNNTTHAWEVPAELGADHIDTHAVTDTWTKYTHSDSANFEAPTGGNFFIAIVGSTISEKVLIDEVECLKDGVGDNQVVNGGFETVVEASAFPTFYDDTSELSDDDDEELEIDIYRTTTIVHSGSNAVRIYYKKRGFIFQAKEGTPGDYVQHTHYARKINAEDISQSCYAVIQLVDGEFGGLYDWSKCEFVAKADIDNTNFLPYMYLRPMTTGYTQFKSPPFPIPESGSYVVLFGGYTDDEVYGNIYIDTARNNLVTLDSNRTIYQITNDTEVMNLLPDDAVFSIDAKDNGEDFNLFKIDGRGKFKTDFDRLDFSDEIIKVDEAVEETSPVPLSQLKELTHHYIGHVDVDWTAEGATKICDIADDEHLVITSVTIITNKADTVSEQPIFSLGNNESGGYNGIYDTATLPTNMNNPKQCAYNWFPASPSFFTIQNGDPIYVNITTGAVANEFTGRIILYGFSTDIDFSSGA